MNGRSEITAYLLAQQRFKLCGSLVDAEPGQSDTRDKTLTIPIDQCFREGVCSVEFDLTIGTHDKHALTRELTQQMT